MDDDLLFEQLMGEVNEAKKESEQKKHEQSKDRGIDFLNKAANGELNKPPQKSKKSSGDPAKGRNAPNYDLGSSAEQIVRLTSKVFLSPYDALMLLPDATEDLVKKRYRKLSLLVHPDKNPDSKNAADAFQIVSKAYSDITSGETAVDLSKYADILDEAKRRVKRQIREINTLRKAKGEDLIPSKDGDITEDVIEMCEKMLSHMEDRREYAKQTLLENLEREEAEEQKAEEEAKQQKELLKEFKKGRDKRGQEWQAFMKSDIAERGVKRAAGFTREELDEEERAAGAVHNPTQVASNLKRRKGGVGIDDSYKKNWR